MLGADGKNQVRLTHGKEHHGHPAWSPEGHTIAYFIASLKLRVKSTIHLMTADGKYLRQLGDGRNAVDYEPDFSPVPLSVSPTPHTATIWGRVKKLATNPHTK